VEPQPGLFVLHGETATFESDPDVPGSQMSELVHDGSIWAGFTRIVDAPEPMTWTPDQREILVVTEGSVRIEFADGTDVTLGVGDAATIPAGVTTTWYVTTPFREMWVLAET
jgi:uncharacterized cupin superfamily protein